MSRNQKIVFAVLVLLAVSLIFFRLTRHDMLGDDGHYAFRSVGYFDFMASENQTTPVQWFDERPSWSWLSFHDHPPMYFLIHFIFFKLFGASVLVARLPSALAGLGTLLASYFLARRLIGIRYALFTMAALSISSYFVWTARVGLLESILVFFIMTGLLFLDKGFERNKYFIYSGLFFGLALLTKYSALSVLPGVAVYILWKHREASRKRNFWIGVGVFALLSLPIWIYNANLYATRGHLDVQLDRVVSIEHHDWDILKGSNVEPSFHGVAFLETVADGVSAPYFFVFVLSFLFLAYLVARRRIGERMLLPVLVFLSQLVFFSFVGSAARWVGTVSPFLALIIGAGLHLGFNRLSRGAARAAAILALAAAGIFSLFYTVNTNTLANAAGGKRYYSAATRLENLGYNQLDREIGKILHEAGKTPQILEAVKVWWYRNFQPPFAGKTEQLVELNTLPRSLIIYDLNTTWFSMLWAVERRKFYQGELIMSVEEFMRVLNDDTGVQNLNSLGLERVYYIHASEAVKQAAGSSFSQSDVIRQDFQRNNTEPKIIYDDKGREAFYIYQGSL